MSSLRGGGSLSVTI